MLVTVYLIEITALKFKIPINFAADAAATPNVCTSYAVIRVDDAQAPVLFMFSISCCARKGRSIEKREKKLTIFNLI